MQPDCGECSEWIDGGQGLLQPGCVLSPLLFNILFAAVLIFGLQKFISQSDGVLKYPVHLKEESTKSGPETELANVRRAMWGTLYAGDTCAVSRSRQGLAIMVSIIAVQICRAFGLTVSEKKTEIIYLTISHARAGNTDRCGRTKLQAN